MKSTRKALKNVITKGCILPLKSFTEACITVIEMPPIIIKIIAFIIATFLELSDKSDIFLYYHAYCVIGRDQTCSRGEHHMSG